MAFGAQIKLSVDKSNKSEFHGQIQQAVDAATSKNPIKIRNVKIDLSAQQKAQIVRQLNDAMKNSELTIKIAKIDTKSAVDKLRRDLTTMLSGLSITGLKEFLGDKASTDALERATKATEKLAEAQKNVQKQINENAAALKEIGTLQSSLNSANKKLLNMGDGEDIERLKQKYRELTALLERAKTATGDKRTAAILYASDEVTAINKEIAAIREKEKASKSAANSAESDAIKEASLMRGSIALRQQINTYIQKNSSAYKAYGTQIDAILTELSSESGVTRERLAQIKAEFAGIKSTADAAGLSGQTFMEKLRAGWEKFGGWSLITKSMMAAVRGIKNMINAVKDLDLAMTELRKVTDLTSAGYEKFYKTAVGVASEVGAKVSDTINATADFARLGFTVDEATELAKAALVYKNVGDGIEDISEATESLISTMKAFRVEAEDSMTIVDMFNEVGNRFAISSVGIGEALQRSASALSVAGNSIEESIGLVVAANNVVQNPAQVGTALKTITMYLRAAKTEAEEAGIETEGMAESVSKLRDEILALTGNKVDVLLDDKTFKSTFQIVKEISQVWDTITSDISKARLLELMGGKRGGNVVSSLITNFQDAEKAAKTAMNAVGSAMKENEKRINSIAGKADILAGKFENLARNLISSDLVKSIISAGSEGIDILNGMIETIGAFPAIIGAATAAFELFGNSIGFAKYKNNGLSLFGVEILKLTDLFKAKSWADIGSNVSNGLKGVSLAFKTFFSHLTSDQKALVLFNRDLQNGVKWEDAFASHMQNASESAQEQAINIAEGSTSLEKLGISAAGAGAKLTLASVGMRALSAAINIGLSMLISWGISALVNFVDGIIHAGDAAKEAAKEAAKAAKETTESVQDAINKYIDYQEAVNNSSITQDEFNESVSNVIQSLSKQGETIDHLIEKYGSLNKAMLGVSKQELSDAEAGLIKAYQDTRDKLLKEAQLKNQEIFSVLNGWGIGETKEQIIQILKDNGYDYRERTVGLWREGYFGLGDVYDKNSISEIITAYNDISDIIKKIREELGEQGTEDGFYKGLQEKQALLGSLIQSYRESLRDYYDNIITQNLISEMIENGVPETQEAYDALRQSVIDATTQNGLYGESLTEVGLSIENMTDSVLASQNAFAGFVAGAVEVNDILSRTEVKALDMSDALKKLKNGYDVLNTAQKEMKENGGISTDTVGDIAGLLSEGEKLTDYIYYENGMLKLNTEAWQERNEAVLASKEQEYTDAAVEIYNSLHGEEELSEEVKNQLLERLEEYSQLYRALVVIRKQLRGIGTEESNTIKRLDELFEESFLSTATKEDIAAYMKKYYGGGNVDWTNRPRVSPEEMSKYGYTDLYGSEYATKFGMKYSKDVGDKSYYILVTPILPDGQVLTQDALDSYVDEIGEKSAKNGMSLLEADAVENGGKGLLYYVDEVDKLTESFKDASDKADAFEAGLSRLQGAYYSKNILSFADNIEDEKNKLERYKSVLDGLYDSYNREGYIDDALIYFTKLSDNTQSGFASEYKQLVAALANVQKAIDEKNKLSDSEDTELVAQAEKAIEDAEAVFIAELSSAQDTLTQKSIEDALKTISSVSSFLTNMGKEGTNTIDMIQAAISLASKVDGTEWTDFVKSFDGMGNIEWNADAIRAFTDALVDQIPGIAELETKYPGITQALKDMAAAAKETTEEATTLSDALSVISSASTFLTNMGKEGTSAIDMIQSAISLASKVDGTEWTDFFNGLDDMGNLEWNADAIRAFTDALVDQIPGIDALETKYPGITKALKDMAAAEAEAAKEATSLSDTLGVISSASTFLTNIGEEGTDAIDMIQSAISLASKVDGKEWTDFVKSFDKAGGIEWDADAIRAFTDALVDQIPGIDALETKYPGITKALKDMAAAEAEAAKEATSLSDTLGVISSASTFLTNIGKEGTDAIDMIQSAISLASKVDGKEWTDFVKSFDKAGGIEWDADAIRAFTDALVDQIPGIDALETKYPGITQALKDMAAAEQQVEEESKKLGEALRTSINFGNSIGRNTEVTEASLKSLLDTDVRYLDTLEYVNGRLTISREKYNEVTNALLQETLAEVEAAAKAIILSEEYQKLAKNEASLLEPQRKRLNELNVEIASYATLASELQNATSAYQRFMNASSDDSKGRYAQAVNALQVITDTIENEDSDIYRMVGRDHFKLAVDFVLGENVDVDSAEFSKGLATVKRYLTKDAEGVTNFYDDLVTNGIIDASTGAFDTTISEISQKLQISEDAARAMMEQLERYAKEKFDWSKLDPGSEAEKAKSSIQTLQEATEAAQKTLDDMNNAKLSIDASAALEATGKVSSSLQDILDLLKSIAKNWEINITETVSKKTNSTGGFLSRILSGFGLASGTKNAAGGKTLVGEIGPEIVVDPKTGRWHTVGVRGPEFVDLTPGSIVLNANQTAGLLGGGTNNSSGPSKAFAPDVSGVDGVAVSSGVSNIVNTVFGWVKDGAKAVSDAFKKINDSVSGSAQNPSASNKKKNNNGGGGSTGITKEEEEALDKILELTEKLVEAEAKDRIDAIKKEVDAYKEIINLKKESLKVTKDENSYQRSVSEKVQEIAKTQAKIDQLSLDNSRAAMAERAKLVEELAKLQTDLSDYQADHAYEAQVTELDKMAENYEKERNTEIEAIEESISSTEKIYRLALERIRTGWASLYDDLIAWNTEQGSIINQEITEEWNNAYEAVKRYGSYLAALEQVRKLDVGGDYTVLPKYHGGGIVGDAGSINDSEVMAILEKGEAVLDDTKKKGLYRIIDFQKALSDKIGATIDNIALVGSNIMRNFGLTNSEINKQVNGSQNVVYSPTINVAISHNGTMSKEDAKVYGKEIADAALDRMYNAFERRGVTGVFGTRLRQAT